MINRREFGKIILASGAAAGAAGLVRLAIGPETRVFAQGTADYSELINWCQANPDAQTWFDSWNQGMVTPFNRLNNGTYSPTDLNNLGAAANSAYNYFCSTGSPTLDWCCTQCVLANVPSPGTASAVLFTNLNSDQQTALYQQSQSYGYNATFGQISRAAYVPNITTWNTSNYFYPLTSTAPSSFLSDAGGGFADAATAYHNAIRLGLGYWSLSPSTCNSLLKAQLAFAAVAAILWEVYFATGFTAFGVGLAALGASILSIGAYYVMREGCAE